MKQVTGLLTVFALLIACSTPAQAQDEAAKVRQNLIGQPAPLMSAVAWTNGKPLTKEDIEGKVMFIDFWAVWCGPCIATFPHLNEWNEKYAEKGLVMIGVTNLYEYGWDAASGRATKVAGITPANELAAMQKFAEHHKLTHRLAVVTDNEVRSQYGVSGIPQAVIIDREGKVRMIKVGSGEDNVKAIDELLAELFSETDAGESRANAK